MSNHLHKSGSLDSASVLYTGPQFLKVIEVYTCICCRLPVKRVYFATNSVKHLYTDGWDIPANDSI